MPTPLKNDGLGQLGLFPIYGKKCSKPPTRCWCLMLLVVSIPLKSISQLGWWHSQYMEKNVPNHQPAPHQWAAVQDVQGKTRAKTMVFGENVIHPYELGYDLTPIDPYNVYNYKYMIIYSLLYHHNCCCTSQQSLVPWLGSRMFKGSFLDTAHHWWVSSKITHQFWHGKWEMGNPTTQLKSNMGGFWHGKSPVYFDDATINTSIYRWYVWHVPI